RPQCVPRQVWRCAMKRLMVVFGAASLLAVASCGDDTQAVTVKISLFEAAPDAVEQGQSSKLLFVVEPAGANLNLSGGGDVTGKTSVMVTPDATTTYHLTAAMGNVMDQKDATITVGPKQAAGLKVEPATDAPIAGQDMSVVVTAITASGATAPGFRGTVHLTSTDAGAILPADFAFAAQDAGVKTVSVTLKAAGTRLLVAADTAS